jgi:hypothetical protein
MKLRFTIRDLLWLTLLVALAVGWRMDHRAIVASYPQPVMPVTIEEGGRTFIFNYGSDVLLIKEGGKWSLRQMQPASPSQIQEASDALQ